MLLLGLGYVRSVRLTKKRVTLVVARYREDVRWLRAFDKDRFDIVCYNKGEPVVDLPSHILQTRLPNVGREAHTYLYHILRTYKNPTTEYVVFLQGHPFDHLQNKNVKELIFTIDNHVTRSPPSSAILFTYHHEPIDLYPELHMQKYMDYFGFRGKRQNTITFTPGAQFIIHRNDILKNPTALYQELPTPTSKTVRGLRNHRVHDRALVALPLRIDCLNKQSQHDCFTKKNDMWSCIPHCWICLYHTSPILLVEWMSVRSCPSSSPCVDLFLLL